MALLTRLFAVLLFAAPAAFAQESETVPNANVKLVTPQTEIRPGEPFEVSLQFELQPGWHIYWKNPGDAGLPTQLRWSAPEGFRIEEAPWPAPVRFVSQGEVSYGYENEVRFNAALIAPADYKGRAAALTVDADFAVCGSGCYPQQIRLSLQRPFNLLPGSPQPGPAWLRTKQPQLEVAAEDNGENIVFRLPDTLKAPDSSLIFFPEDSSVLRHDILPRLQAAGSILEVTLSKKPDVHPETIKGLLVYGSEPPLDLALRVSAPAASAPFVTALFFAFIGGLILNLMPCVFPVLSIKVLGFVESCGQKHAWRHAALFSAGVLCSFWLLGSLLLILRRAGAELGWGFQFQSPVFVGCMAILIFVIGLNLAGLFEFGMALQRWAGRFNTGSGAGGAFFSGVVATLLATPCTAPFMGSALAAAMAMDPLKALAVFTSLGAGMSLPYVLLSCIPAAVNLLPRPGAWMVTFKQLMSFPMFATAAWLISVLVAQVGSATLLHILIGLVLISLSAWTAGNFSVPLHSAKVRFLALTVSLFLFIAGCSLAIGSGLTNGQQAQAAVAQDGLEWQPYTQAKLEELRQKDRAVLVELSAEWCLTCQMNHKLVFSNGEVIRRIRERSVIPLLGDWTKFNPEVTQMLKRFARGGVPLTVLYRPDEDPVVMPAVFPPAMLLAELEKVASR